MIDRQKLLSDLQSLLRAVEADLLARSEDAELPEVSGWLKAEYVAAKDAGRTAQTLKSWIDDFVTQVAAAWVLSCVFVRYLEDNSLVDPPRIAGSASDSGSGQSRLKWARDEYDHWVQNNRGQTDRDYLLDIFQGLAGLPAAGEVFGPHNPLNALPNWLSGDAARAILAFFQKVDSDSEHPALIHDFTDASGDTRFLGDLYQDLSEAARKKYALLQTPDFVEAFILDRTLEPALDEFGLTPISPLTLHSSNFLLIDPACGSGHFLLGAFPRILARWQKKEPGEKIRVLVQRALDSIHGVDVNPYAIAIARFRLLLAAMAAEGVKKLKDAPAYRLHLACGDSLWHAPLRGNTGSASRGQMEFVQVSPEADDERQSHTYFAEDAARLKQILAEGQYHCVVANPPYIVPRDAALNQDYRARYESCHRQYSLAVPFMERIFRLAVSSSPDTCNLKPETSRAAGYTGQITANSFMKREFGKKLIEQFLPSVDLTHVIDTSGAYIPGHGTPTTILFGRNRPPVAPTIRTVMGIKGEPSTPDNPADGLVWTAIVEQIDQPRSESDFVSAGDSDRTLFGKHPWSIGGGGAAELKEQLEDASSSSLTNVAAEIGFAAISGEDNVFLVDRSTANRVQLSQYLPLVEGETIRDWICDESLSMLWPNDVNGRRLPIEDLFRFLHFLWPWRQALKERKLFGVPVEQKGIPWWAIREVYLSKFAIPLSIAYAEVATHNHFVLDRGGKVFKQTAPVIKLPAEIESEDGSRRPVTEDDHLALLGLLNSSTACFWMKQVCFPKGGDHVGQEGARVRRSLWDERYAFNATNMQQFPLPSDRPLLRAKRLDELSRQLAEVKPSRSLSRTTSVADTLVTARQTTDRLRSEMVRLQEDLDWHWYQLYGLIDEAIVGPFPLTLLPEAGGGEPEIFVKPGQRAFEIVLARKIAAGKAQSTWFERHGMTPITELPAHWPDDYKALVNRRIEIIESDPNIALIEQPEYKRRWNTEPWESQVERAMQSWLLDRLESYFDFDGRMNDDGQPTAKVETELVSIACLADIAASDEAFMEVAAVYRDDPAFNVSKLVEDLVLSESVPLLPVLRYKPSGLRKREQWEETWELQRREDALSYQLSVVSAQLEAEQDEAKKAALRAEVDRLTTENRQLTTSIPVPPKYTSADFISTGGARYWALRGKLDVPKERWISFPHCPGSDGTMMICWAGYDHLQQALAISAHYQAIKEEQGGDEDSRLIPLLAAICELIPWLKQWHSEIDPTYQMSMADYFEGFLTEEARTLNQTIEEIKAWQPPAQTRGRRRSAT